MNPFDDPTAATLGDRYGRRAIVGSRGEQRTAELLAAAYDNDDTTVVVHNLAIPGWDRANIDHVAIRSSTLVALDTKNWSPGRYWTLRSTRRGIHPFPPADKIRLADQCAALAAVVRPERAAPLVVLWPSKPGYLRTRRPLASLRLPAGVPHCHGADLVAVLEPLLGVACAPPNPDLVAAVLRFRKRR
jgi:hypothetical protein